MSYQSKKVLVIGQEQFNKTIISAVFKNPDYEVFDCNDGDQAIEIAKNKSPEIVIIETVIMEYIDDIKVTSRNHLKALSNGLNFDVLDVSFPKDNFINAVVVLMQKFINIPIVGVSICKESKPQAECFSRLVNISGSNETISKPINRQQFFSVFDDWLNEALLLFHGSIDRNNSSSNFSQKRVVKQPIPDNLNQLITKEQHKTIQKLDKLGWELLFVRRPVFQTVDVIVIDKNGIDTARVNEDGKLIKKHDIVLRS